MNVLMTFHVNKPTLCKFFLHLDFFFKVIVIICEVKTKKIKS